MAAMQGIIEDQESRAKLRRVLDWGIQSGWEMSLQDLRDVLLGSPSPHQRKIPEERRTPEGPR
jgi:hypothetical protein